MTVRRPGGLLIVNADDWGGFEDGTNAILRAFQAGAITSTTAMVYMADSERAAALAGEHGLPTGLHLNLTQPFDGEPVADAVRERQRRLCARLWPLTVARRWLFDPRPSTNRLIRDVVADQLEAFQSLYGRSPTHVDSHQHAHSAPDVFLRLPKNLPLRRPGSVRAHLVARRFRTTDSFHSIVRIHPLLGGEGLEGVVRAATHSTVEIMVHPSFPRELPVLLSDEWRDCIGTAPLGSFADLAARGT